MSGLFEIALTICGVVLPSALLAMAVNRWLAPVPVRLGGLLIALVLATLHLGVFTSEMPVPLDEVVRGYPYKGVVGESESRNPVTNDVVKQMLPWMDVAREELFAGRAPLWNRYSFSGYPLLGNAQSAPFSPFFLATLFVPLPKQIVAMAGLKLFVALVFGVLFLREEGAGDAAAIAGSMLFAFSVIQNVYLYYPLSSVTCLLPALAWSIVRSMRQGRRNDRVALALVTCAAFASGHPETVFHLAIAAVMIIVVEIVSGRSGGGLVRRSGLTLGYAILGVMLASAVWLPSVEQIAASQRVDALETGNVESPVFPGNALWAAIHPDVYGNPARGTWRWIFNYPMVAPTFVGLVALMLLPGALVSPSSERRARLFALSALVMLVVSMRWSVLGELFDSLPLASAAANDRLRFVMVFFAAAAVAIRLSAIARKGPSPVDLLSGVVVLFLSVYVYRELVDVTIVRGHLVVTAGLAVFLTMCLAASMSLWRDWKLEGATHLPLVAAIVIGIELFAVNLPYNALTPRSMYAPSLPIVDALHAAAPDEPYRVVGFDWVFLPNASAHYALEDVRGSDPMASGRYTRFFTRLQAEGQGLDVLRTQRIGDSAIDFLNVRFLVAEPGFDAGEGWRRIYSGRDGELFENEEWVRRFFAPDRLLPEMSVRPDEVKDLRTTVVVDEEIGASRDNPPVEGMWIREMSPGRYRLTVDAPEPTLIASSVPAVRGWKVEVDGAAAPIVRVNGAFVGFHVPAGTSKVRLIYEPWSWRIGLYASLLGLVGLVATSRRLTRR